METPTKIGLYREGVWFFDFNGNGAWDAGVDRVYTFGAYGWTPLTGDWNGIGTPRIGVTNGQQWYLDSDGNGHWNYRNRLRIHIRSYRVDSDDREMELKRGSISFRPPIFFIFKTTYSKNIIPENNK